jgi:hypothetical protein
MGPATLLRNAAEQGVGEFFTVLQDVGAHDAVADFWIDMLGQQLDALLGVFPECKDTESALSLIDTGVDIEVQRAAMSVWNDVMAPSYRLFLDQGPDPIAVRNAITTFAATINARMNTVFPGGEGARKSMREDQAPLVPYADAIIQCVAAIDLPSKMCELDDASFETMCEYFRYLNGLSFIAFMVPVAFVEEVVPVLGEILSETSNFSNQERIAALLGKPHFLQHVMTIITGENTQTLQGRLSLHKETAFAMTKYAVTLLGRISGSEDTAIVEQYMNCLQTGQMPPMPPGVAQMLPSLMAGLSGGGGLNPDMLANLAGQMAGAVGGAGAAGAGAGGAGGSMLPENVGEGAGDFRRAMEAALAQMDAGGKGAKSKGEDDVD